MKTRSFVLACATVGGLAVAGCGADAIDPPPPLTTPETSDTGTKFVDPDAANNAGVHDGGLDFPSRFCNQLAALKPGTIIASDRQAPGSAGTNPDGFLVRVKSVTCDSSGVHVKTEPVSIPDAFPNLKLDAGINLPACKDLKGPSLGVDYGGALFQYRGTAKTTDGRDIPFDAAAMMDLSLCFAPKLTLKADVAGFKLNSLEVSATGTLEAKALFSAVVKLDPSVDAKTRADLAGKPLSKSVTQVLTDKNLDLGSVDAAGVKLPVSARYVATLACDFAFTAPVEVSVGAKATASVTAGLVYEGGTLSPKTDHTTAFEPIPPTFKQDGMLRATCAVVPKIQVKLFGIATGELGAKVYGGMGASQTCGGKDAAGVTQRLTHGDVESGAAATALAKLEVFGLTKWKKECTLFDEDGVVQYDHAYPTPGGVGAACTVAGPFPLPPKATANPQACFGSDGDAVTPAIIVGECTHDVCTAGDKLGQQCDDCTMKVCAVDTYCCDTYWGLSCFDDVQRLCGKKCGGP